MKDPFYITTTLPYVNAIPHIGHAMEMIRADVIARYKRYSDYDVFFNTGTDEHGQKILEGANKENMNVKDYVDKYSQKFKDFHIMCNISYDAFIRTTDDKHIRAAQKMWNICMQNGDIYKAKQRINYCVGCEMEKTDSDLNEDGKCPDHPNRDLVVTEEENYFFKFSKYQTQLLELYKNILVRPDFRNNEIKKFVEGGLHDFSVSRLKSKMPWGVSVPGDEEHVMYVWFDALTSYIATLDWVDEGENFKKYWLQDLSKQRQVIQVCGKDNNKAQSAIWQAMLLSSGIKNTNIININGHIISGGIKMSKSIGNVISPFDIVENYKLATNFSEDVLRFVMCHEVSTFDDSDITSNSIKEAYKVFLQNGIGNQVSRILKLTSEYVDILDVDNIVNDFSLKNNTDNKKSILDKDFILQMDNFRLNEAIHIVTDKSKKLDEYIQETSPFKLVKYKSDLTQEQNLDNLNQAKQILHNCIRELLIIATHLSFFMPRTSDFIFEAISKNKALEKGIFGQLL